MKITAFFIIGIMLAAVGILNFKGNILTVRYYNRRNVQEKDIPKYGKCIGTGCLTARFSLIISAVLELIFKTDVFDYLVLGGVLAGIAVMLYAQFRFNKGIF